MIENCERQDISPGIPSPKTEPSVSQPPRADINRRHGATSGKRSPWTPEAIALLNDLARTTDHRPREIATLLNERFPTEVGEDPLYSRSAVIGKAFRDELKIRGATKSTHGGRRTAPAATPNKRIRAKATRKTNANAAAQGRTAPAATRTTDVMRIKIRAGAASLEALHQTLIDQHEAEGHDLFAQPIKAVVDCPDAKHLWAETIIYHPATMPEGRCQHPTGISRKTRTQLFCGSPTERHKTYCEPHGRLCRPG